MSIDASASTTTTPPSKSTSHSRSPAKVIPSPSSCSPLNSLPHERRKTESHHDESEQPVQAWMQHGGAWVGCEEGASPNSQDLPLPHYTPKVCLRCLPVMYMCGHGGPCFSWLAVFKWEPDFLQARLLPRDHPRSHTKKLNNHRRAREMESVRTVFSRRSITSSPVRGESTKEAKIQKEVGTSDKATRANDSRDAEMLMAQSAPPSDPGSAQPRHAASRQVKGASPPEPPPRRASSRMPPTFGGMSDKTATEYMLSLTRDKRLSDLAQRLTIQPDSSSEK